MTTREMAEVIVKALDAKKATDIALLELTELTVLADYFIICTGSSTTHIKAMADEAERVMAQVQILPHHTEGYLGGGWILLDFSGVVVHLFIKDMREFYLLERMWSDARRIDISALTNTENTHGLE